MLLFFLFFDYLSVIDLKLLVNNGKKIIQFGQTDRQMYKSLHSKTKIMLAVMEMTENLYSNVDI